MARKMTVKKFERVQNSISGLNKREINKIIKVANYISQNLCTTRDGLPLTGAALQGMYREIALDLLTGAGMMKKKHLITGALLGAFGTVGAVVVAQNRK